MNYFAPALLRTHANTHRPSTPHSGMQLATQSENKLWHWRNKHALITHKHVDSRSGAVKSQLIFSLAMYPSSSSSHPLLFHCHNTTSWSYIYICVGGASTAPIFTCNCLLTCELLLQLQQKQKQSENSANYLPTVSPGRPLYLLAQVAATPSTHAHVRTRTQIRTLERTEAPLWCFCAVQAVIHAEARAARADDAQRAARQ